MPQEINPTATPYVMEWLLKNSSSDVIRKMPVRVSDITLKYELEKQTGIITIKFFYRDSELMEISSDSTLESFHNTFDGRDGSGVVDTYDNWIATYLA